MLFAALALALGLYLIYNRISRTPDLNVGAEPNLGGVIADGNAAGLDGEVGKIGDVKIGNVRETEFFHCNNRGAVDRAVGFQGLLHQVKDIWDVEKPYMNVYQRNFDCFVTADRGSVQLETSVGNPTPKDATFTGNVVIHIVPKGTQEFKESFIYLDDIVFLSEKSQFATAGPVRFVSETANMLGKGLEMVYDDQTERLEYLRLVHLESLRVKTAEAALFSKGDKRADANEGSPKATLPQADKAPGEAAKPPAPADGRASASPTTGVVQGQPPIASSKPVTAQEQGYYYKCILSKNVYVETPEQLVFAGDSVSINDIFWARPKAQESDKAAGDVSTTTGQEPATEPPKQAGPVSQVGKDASAVAADANQTRQKIVEITVTCENGVLLVPMDSKKSVADFAADMFKPKISRTISEADQTTGQGTFVTRSLDYSAVSGDANALGRSRLRFYSSDLPGADANKPAIPITVTAATCVKYARGAQQVVFDGNCVCTMPQEGLSAPRDTVFRSPRLTVNLAKTEPNNRLDLSDIIAAGPVELTFHVDDPNAAQGGKEPVPVKVTARKHARFFARDKRAVFEEDCTCTMPQVGLPAGHNYVLKSPTLTVNIPDQKTAGAGGLADVIASGVAQVSFYAKEPASASASASRRLLPVSVTAKKQIHFVPSSNQVILEGDCLCKMVQADPNGEHTYTLESPILTVDLASDANDRSSQNVGGIRRITAHGGLARLATVRKVKDVLFGGTVLD